MTHTPFYYVKQSPSRVIKPSRDVTPFILPYFREKSLILVRKSKVLLHLVHSRQGDVFWRYLFTFLTPVTGCTRSGQNYVLSN